MSTRVVNVRREVCDVYVGRSMPGWPSTGWGNPFRIARGLGTREEAIVLYRAWIVRQPHLMARLPELRGQRLGCWCAPLPCHADVLAELADESEADA